MSLDLLLKLLSEHASKAFSSVHSWGMQISSNLQDQKVQPYPQHVQERRKELKFLSDNNRYVVTSVTRIGLVIHVAQLGVP